MIDFNKILRRLPPQGIGFALMLLGWYISIVNVGLDKFTSPTIFTKASAVGLLIILIGAYTPQIWIAILNRLKK